MILALRLAVLLLVLFNVLLFARSFIAPAKSPDAGRLDQQVLPERVKVVAFADPPATGVARDEVHPAVEAPRVTETCQIWGDLPNADAEQLQRLLTEQFPAFKAARRVSAETTGYWVFVPPLENKEAATRKTAELQQLGVQDFFVLHASGPNQYAVSLGTYRTEEAANAGLEALRAKGVKSAKVGERKGKAINAFEIRGPQEQAEMLREAVLALLPKAHPTDCPKGKEGQP